MRKKILGVVVPVVIAVVCGWVVGKYIYRVYREGIDEEFKNIRLYLLEGGSYDSYDDMRKDNSGNNYIYYREGDEYKTVLGITKDYENIDKIKRLYSNEMRVDEYYVSKENFKDEMMGYDRELANSEDIYKIREVVDNILDLYKEEDSIRLISIQ